MARNRSGTKETLENVSEMSSVQQENSTVHESPRDEGSSVPHTRQSPAMEIIGAVIRRRIKVTLEGETIVVNFDGV